MVHGWDFDHSNYSSTGRDSKWLSEPDEAEDLRLAEREGKQTQQLFPRTESDLASRLQGLKVGTSALFLFGDLSQRFLSLSSNTCLLPSCMDFPWQQFRMQKVTTLRMAAHPYRRAESVDFSWQLRCET